MKRSVIMKVYMFLKKKWIEFFILLVGLVAIRCSINTYSSADLYYFGKVIAEKNELLLNNIKNKDLKVIAEADIKGVNSFTLVVTNDDLRYATMAIMEKKQEYLEKIIDSDWKHYAMARMLLDEEYIAYIKNPHLKDATMDIVAAFKKENEKKVPGNSPNRQQELKMYLDDFYDQGLK